MQFLAIIFLLLFPSKVYAASDFTTSFESVYTIGSTGDTNVKHTISLKNNLSHIYATEYTIQTGGDDLKNITARDEYGDMATETKSQNGLTSIHMRINRPSIGKDQIKNIILNYDAPDIVEKIGNTMTINIPRLEKANESENYRRIVKVYGVEEMPELIYPQANTKIAQDGYSVYTFDGHGNDSLSLLFGESVTYKLDLTYELKNNEITDVDTELALPSDTDYQSIIIGSIDPKPLNINLDENGNWMARYTLKSQSKIIVKAVLYTTVYPVPSLKDPSSTAFISSHKSKYWQTNSTTVSEISSKLKTPENIYTYLVENFSYNFTGLNSKIERLGAITALTSPSNVLCTEFTDSFIALARSANIPSREINGYGYAKNPSLQPQNKNADILHSWPEFYSADKKAWISIDPTWGNTTSGINYFEKLDFSHIAFVRHGIEDSYPLPAGAYKSNAADKYVQVEVASDIPEIVQNTETLGNKIINTGNVSIFSDEYGYIPPYGSTIKIDSKHPTLYDKIKQICAKLLSIF